MQSKLTCRLSGVDGSFSGRPDIHPGAARVDAVATAVLGHDTIRLCGLFVQGAGCGAAGERACSRADG